MYGGCGVMYGVDSLMYGFGGLKYGFCHRKSSYPQAVESMLDSRLSPIFVIPGQSEVRWFCQSIAAKFGRWFCQN